MSIDLKIDENIEKLIKITNIYDDTHEWGCNDTVMYLYVKLICSILQGKDDINLRTNDFIKYVYDIDI